MKSYTDLDVWKDTRILVLDIYQLTNKFPKEEQYGLTSQMRRCSVSVPSNIAEGHGRNTAKDTLHFFYIARGSLFELETQIYLSSDLNFISSEITTLVLDKITSCKKMLNGLIRYYKTLISNIEKPTSKPQ